MRIKTFEAPTMQEALAIARQELGDDAVVLNTKHVKASGLMGLRGGTKIELMAAVDDNAVLPVQPPSEPIARSSEAYHKPFTLSSESVSKCVTAEKPGQLSAGGVSISESDNELVQLREEVKQLGAVVRGLVNRPLTPSQREGELTPLSSGEGQGERSPLLVKLGIDEDLANGALADLLSVEDPMTLASMLAGKMQAFTSPPVIEGNKQVIALVGPTGVGKTTTLAKLAARFSLERHVKVALVTADTFRIGAVEQLRTYARIMGIPLEVALSPEEVSAAIEKHSDKDVILVDTVGRSQRNEEHLAELKSFIDAAKPTEIDLVISASLSKRTQEEVVERFTALSPTKLLITKLDETPELACLVNLPLRTGLPISCLTAGQNVPQDIDFADAGVIARLVTEVA